MTREQLILSIVVSLLTIIGSGVMSAVVTFKLNARKDERHFRRQKLEELNLAVNRFCVQMDTNFLPYMSAMTGKITYNQALDTVLGSKDEERAYDKLSMLVNIYFHDLEPRLEKIHEARDEGNRIVQDFKRYYQTDGMPSQPHFQSMQNFVAMLDKAEFDFKDAIREEALKLA